MPGVRVGRHARIRRAIIDRDVFIPRGAQIGYNEEEDRRRHTVSDNGVVVVTKDDEPFTGPITEEALRLRGRVRSPGSGAVTPRASAVGIPRFAHGARACPHVPSCSAEASTSHDSDLNRSAC